MACFALLMGCAGNGDPAKDGVTVAFKNEQAKAFVAGQPPVKVSLAEKGAGENPKKINAECKLDSSKYSASFIAPAKVNIPAYLKGAVDATLTCTSEGETYTKTFKPVNLSRKSRNDSAAAVGLLLCPICGIGMAIGNSTKKEAQENDVLGFHELKIEI